MRNEVVVQSFRTRLEAELAKGALAAHKINSRVSSDDNGASEPYPFANTFGVRLFILVKDLEKAKKILKVKIS